MLQTGRILIIIGAVFIIAGIVFVFGGKLGPLGHLPGDIIIKKKNTTIFIPLATSLLISIGLTIVLYLIRLFNK
jgi:hypothetical protein